MTRKNKGGSISISAAVYERLKAAADAKGVGVMVLVQQALAEFFEPVIKQLTADDARDIVRARFPGASCCEHPSRALKIRQKPTRFVVVRGKSPQQNEVPLASAASRAEAWKLAAKHAEVRGASA